MTIIEALIQLRDDLKLWVANNLRVTKEEMDAKADIEHTHTVSDVDELQTALDTLQSEVSGKTSTTIRLPQEDITEVNLSTTAQSGEIILGTAATKAITNNTSTSTYLSANTNTVPTCATLYNFVQVSMEEISSTIPANSYVQNVVLDNPATKNEILVPVGSSDYSYYISLHNSSNNNYYADSITFRRTPDTSLSQAMSVTCWLMRLKVMKY